MRSQISEAQLAANRANAQQSSGPRSEAGKTASSQNRRKYGLTGNFVVLPEEDESEYLALFESLRKDFKPANEIEELLVRKMAQHQWQADRALYHQANSFYKEDFFAFEKQVSLFMRYHTLHDRAFHKALAELRKVQKERKEQELQIPEMKARAMDIKLTLIHKKLHDAVAKTKAESTISKPNGFESQNAEAAPNSEDRKVPAAA